MGGVRMSVCHLAGAKTGHVLTVHPSDHSRALLSGPPYIIPDGDINILKADGIARLQSTEYEEVNESPS